MKKGLNSFAALGSSSDEASSDEDDEVSKGTISSASMATAILKTVNSDENSSSDQQSQRQAGGSVAMRIDPIVGLDNDKTVDLGLKTSDIEACYRVIEVLGKNSNLFKLPALKKLRAALHPLIMEQLKSNYQATGNAFKDDAEGKRGRKRRKTKTNDEIDRETRAIALETEYINQTQLRAVRMQQLESLNDDGFDVPRVPDGVALLTNGSSSGRLMLTAGSTKAQLKLLDSSAITGSTTNSNADDVNLTELREPISCYICHKPYKILHFFYHQLCPECATFNYSKRDEMADMRGKVCLVTGARQKIGYRCALKLLRCGASVIATTRFPVDASKRFLQEADSSDWFSRLHVYGVDFRNLIALEWFCSYVIANYDRLDAIVNNAAQTVRRPPAYYAHLVEGEKQLSYDPSHEFPNVHFDADDGSKNNRNSDNDTTSSSCSNNDNSNSSNSSSSNSSTASSSCNKCDAESVTHTKSMQSVLYHQRKYTTSLKAAVEGSTLTYDHNSVNQNSTQTLVKGHGMDDPEPLIKSREFDIDSDTHRHVMEHIPEDGQSQMTPAISSSEMTQIQLTKGDDAISSSLPESLFPSGATDVNGQQVDLRTHNSWTMRLHEVSTPELAEVFAINAIAPAIINARLKPLMERDPDVMKFIVNVSAMEGKFYRFKSANHPHTNMAKASLNMMTRTSAQDYVKSKIYMTAVDTGWINDEKPIELAAKHHQKHNFQTPIDELDAASRVLDPIIAPLLAHQNGETVEPPWGFFLKDYQKCEW